jgi:N-acetylglucosamine kinase-like BadF-type ATPase
LDLQGLELGKAEGPPALIDPSDPGSAAAAITETVKAAVRQAGLELPARALWTGLAGAGRPGAREAVEIALRSEGLALDSWVGMDVEGAHWDAFQSGPGFLLAVGTGSMVWGRDPDGGTFRVGGWGNPLSEEGSGYWLGLEALRAVVRATDHRDPPTLLTPTLLAALHLPDPQALIPWIARASKGEVGALAPTVLEIARGGDPAAQAILSRGLEGLALHLAVVRRAWAPWGDRFPLALSGGLLEVGAPFRDPVVELVTEMKAELYTAPVIPVRGAARLAQKLASA